MCGVFDFPDEEIAWVDDTGNVQHHDFSIRLDFVDLCFAEVEMLDAFAGDGGRPVHASFIVIEDTNGFGSIGHTQVSSMMFDSHQFDGATIGGVYLGFAGAEGCLVLTKKHARQWGRRSGR